MASGTPAADVPVASPPSQTQEGCGSATNDAERPHVTDVLTEAQVSLLSTLLSTPPPLERVAEVSPKTYDVFISHASEDKTEVALPLADYLERQGFRVWLDIFELTVGDSLRRSIDHGLSASKFGIVILSPAFLGKVWTNEELDGLVARQDGKHKVILPVWHHVSQEDILRYSPMLAGKVGISTAEGLGHVANAIVRAMTQAGSENTSSPLRRVPLEEQRSKEMSELRMQMLATQSFQGLREVEFKVDEFLTRYPNYPEARLLKMQVTESMYPRRSDREPYRESPIPRVFSGRRYLWAFCRIAFWNCSNGVDFRKIKD